jgi:membrane peptidoglycan carboxypeptidase
MKLKTLELYLNYIELGNNSFGIEAASKAYFGVSASGLTVLQSSILASLPKSPTLYSPLKEEGRKNLMGYFTITDGSEKTYPFEGNLKQEIITKFRDAIKNADFSNKKGDNASTRFLVGLGSFSILSEGKEYYVKYFNGRKDVVLSRMFDDEYISVEELKQAYMDGIDVTFQSSAFPIKAPHFVFWIKEYLEKQYGEDAVLKGGMIVKTTLDYTIQQKAEEAFKANERTLYSNGATNSSMLYMDTNNGDVLAYIGSIDYFNDEIQGQNDMVRKPRQSGSSIKPLLYALGFQKLPLTIDTPIYDIPFQVGPDKPNNADDKFEGILPLKYALGHSRNIPSVKLFEAVGGEEVVKPYFQQLGLSGILTDRDYGYPLALGAGEVTMLELAEAYAYLTTSTPAELNPILEITASDGSLIYQKEVKEKETDLVPDGIKYLMRKILSDPNNRLPGRVSKFNVAGLTYALKTGTSNVKTPTGNRPRDGWLAAYTPDNLILMRAGNANATPMNANAFGGTIHADPIKQLLKELLAENFITNKEMPNLDTATLSISKLTGKVAREDTPTELQVSTIGYAQNLPSTVEGTISALEYDSLCLGLASPLTPSTELKQGYLVEGLSSFMPNQRDAEDIKWYFQESALATPVDT